MMHFYLDASAWAKRYQAEDGTPWLAKFWKLAPAIVCSELGLLEVMAAVARRHANAGFDLGTTRESFAEIRADFMGFRQVPLSSAVLAVAEPLLLRHRLRAADSIHRASAISFRDASREAVTVVASDVELLRAAAAEGFACLNPQVNPPYALA